MLRTGTESGRGFLMRSSERLGCKMSRANVNQPSSIEQAYPRQAFDEDAGANSRPKAEVFHGVRITSASDGDGSFELVRASRQVGEIDPESDTLFLFPQLVPDVAALPETDSVYGSANPQPPQSSPQDEADSYRAFLARIGEAARTATFKPAIGRGEERLRGFHGG